MMRRRLDIPPLPILLPDGAMYHLADGQLIPYIDHDESDFGGSDGQELSAMPSSGMASQDYVARARYLVGTPSLDDGDMGSALDARRMIAKLERATTELRQGLLGKFLLQWLLHDMCSDTSQVMTMRSGRYTQKFC